MQFIDVKINFILQFISRQTLDIFDIILNFAQISSIKGGLDQIIDRLKLRISHLSPLDSSPFLSFVDQTIGYLITLPPTKPSIMFVFCCEFFKLHRKGSNLHQAGFTKISLMILLYVLVEMVAYVLQNQRFFPQFHERNILLFWGFFAYELKHFFLSGNFKFDGAHCARTAANCFESRIQVPYSKFESLTWCSIGNSSNFTEKVQIFNLAS